MLKYVMPSAVFILMVSIGMSLNRGEVAANWRRLSAAMWLRLLLATFLIPQAAALLLFRSFRLACLN